METLIEAEKAFLDRWGDGPYIPGFERGDDLGQVSGECKYLQNDEAKRIPESCVVLVVHAPILSRLLRRIKVVLGV